MKNCRAWRRCKRSKRSSLKNRNGYMLNGTGSKKKQRKLRRSSLMLIRSSLLLLTMTVIIGAAHSLSKAGHLLLTGDALHPWEKVREIETFSLRQYRTEKSARYRQVWYNKAMDTRSHVFPRRSAWNLLNIIKLVLGREGECGPFPASAGSKGIAH